MKKKNNKRDDFTKKDKETLSKRVGNLCSNPQCNTPTFGPHSDSTRSINLGVAAHITAASFGGPRYDKFLTEEKRGSISNGIWLCQKCSDLIDKDEIKYTVAELNRWKKIAEERAENALQNPRIVNYGPDFAETTLICFIQKENLILDPHGYLRRRKITLKPVQANRTLIDSTLPLLLGRQINKGEILYNLVCQNMGTGIERDSKIDFSMNGNPLIKKIIIEHENRVQVIGGGKNSSSFAIFHIPSLLPGEIQTIKIIAKIGTLPNIKLSTQNSISKEVFIYEYVF